MKHRAFWAKKCSKPPTTKFCFLLFKHKGILISNFTCNWRKIDGWFEKHKSTEVKQFKNLSLNRICDLKHVLNRLEGGGFKIIFKPYASTTQYPRPPLMMHVDQLKVWSWNNSCLDSELEVGAAHKSTDAMAIMYKEYNKILRDLIKDPSLVLKESSNRPKYLRT